MSDLFVTACEVGDLAALLLLPTPDYGDIWYGLAGACSAGHLDVAKWLHATFKINPGKLLNFRLLIGVCENGHLEVAQWLHATFGFAAADVRSEKNRALYMACENGHLEILKWLHATFALTAEDARKTCHYDNYALVMACRNGHFEVAKLLHATFGLTADDARSGDNLALFQARAGGYLEIAKWLHKTFMLTAKDARGVRNGVLSAACISNHLGVSKWLHAEFVFTAGDLFVADANLIVDSSVMYKVCVRNFSEIVRWWFETFDLTVAHVGQTNEIRCRILKCTKSAEILDILFRVFEREGHEPAGLDAETQAKYDAAGTRVLAERQVLQDRIKPAARTN